MLLLFALASAALSAETLQDVLAALAAHPVIEEPRSEASASALRAEGASAWADPVLGLELSNANLADPLLTHPMSGVQVRVSQRLDGLGRTALVREYAALRAELAALDTEEATLRARVAIQEAWARAAHAHGQADLFQAHRERVVVLRDVATRHYEVGHGGQSALLRLEVLERQLDQDILDWRTSARVFEAELGMWAREPVTVADRPVVVPVPEDTTASPDGRPAWRSLGVAEEAAGVAAEREAREGRPPVTAWAGYRLRTAPTDGTDLATVGLSMPIPTVSARRQSLESRAFREQAAARSQAQAALGLKIEEQVAAARFRWARAAERARVYGEELVPSAQAAREATLSDYRVNRAAFADVLEAEVSVLALQRIVLGAATETRLQQLAVERLLGTPSEESP